MKALISLFLALAIFGIAWGYTPEETRAGIKKMVRKNLLPIAFAVMATAMALFVSTNTTLRFL